MAMDLLIQSCKDSAEYPQNIIHHDALSYNLKMHCSRLSQQGNQLFNESQAAVDFLDLNDGNKGELLMCSIGQVADEAGI